MDLPFSSISSDAGVSSSCIRDPSYKNLDRVKGKKKSNELSNHQKSFLIHPIKDRVRTDPYAIMEGIEKVIKIQKKRKTDRILPTSFPTLLA